MNLSLIDVVQAQAAHKWKATMSKEETDPYVWYDLFVRPTEVLFARKAAMNDKLVYAFKCQQHTTNLFTTGLQPGKLTKNNSNHVNQMCRRNVKS